MNAEIRASITVPPQCIPAAVHPTIDNDAWSYWGGFWNSHMGSFPQGWGIIAALRWYGEGKHRFAVVFAWCVATSQSCWFNKGRGTFRTRAVILWYSVWFVLTNRRGKKKRSTGERKKNVWACWKPALAECWCSMKRFVVKLSAISVIPQFSILYTALKCLGLCFWTSSFLLLHLTCSILNYLATPR